MFGIAAAVETNENWEASMPMLEFGVAASVGNTKISDADMLIPWVLLSRFVQRARAMEHSTMGPGNTTLTCLQLGQAAEVSVQLDGLPQIMVSVSNPLSLEPRSRTQSSLEAGAA